MDQVPRKRLHAVPDGMQGLLNQFETDESKIQHSLDQLGQDISVIKTNLEKKKPKISLSDLNKKLDLILQYLQGINA